MSSSGKCRLRCLHMLEGILQSVAQPAPVTSTSDVAFESMQRYKVRAMQKLVDEVKTMMNRTEVTVMLSHLTKALDAVANNDSDALNTSVCNLCDLIYAEPAVAFKAFHPLSLSPPI